MCLIFTLFHFLVPFYIADDVQAVLHAVQDETCLYTQYIHDVDFLTRFGAIYRMSTGLITGSTRTYTKVFTTYTHVIVFAFNLSQDDVRNLHDVDAYQDSMYTTFTNAA